MSLGDPYRNSADHAGRRVLHRLRDEVRADTKCVAVLNGFAQFLLASNVALSRLHRGMTQQKLDLFRLYSTPSYLADQNRFVRVSLKRS
jgi:hypothetical protein